MLLVDLVGLALKIKKNSMQNDTFIHSRKYILERLSNTSFTLGIIAIIAFAINYFSKTDIAKELPFTINLETTPILVSCLVFSIITTLAVIAVTIVYKKNFMNYHIHAIIGLILTIAAIILNVVL